MGSNATETLIMKKLFAFIGLCVVLKKGHELYTQYTELKREQRQRADSSRACRNGLEDDFGNHRALMA
jgi:hypothetical protein